MRAVVSEAGTACKNGQGKKEDDARLGSGNKNILKVLPRKVLRPGTLASASIACSSSFLLDEGQVVAKILLTAVPPDSIFCHPARSAIGADHAIS